MPLEKKMPPDVGSKFVETTLKTWIYPEIERRKLEGTLDESFVLKQAQIIWGSNKTQHGQLAIRLNNEVQMELYCELNSPKSIGELVFLSDIKKPQDNMVARLKKDEINLAHITIIFFDKINVLCAFDARYNKQTSLQHLERASEFLNVAEYALAEQCLNPCLDLLYSAAELAAKAYLITLPTANNIFKTKRNKHNKIRSDINKAGDLSNIDNKFPQVLNKLQKLRSSARYLDGEQTVVNNTVIDYLHTIKLMIKDNRRKTVS